MNKIIMERTWELASSQIHNEAVEADLNDLEINSSVMEYQHIKKDVSTIHLQLKEAAPLTHGSVVHSWDQITRYFKKKKVHYLLKLSKYAAIIIVAFGIGTFININWKAISEEQLFSEIVAPLGQMSEMTLYDGTKVWLNSGTKLRYPNNFGKESRMVELEGEAFFKVEPDEVPFRIKIKNNEIEVLGTSFAAVAYPDENFSQVTLVEGSVQLNDHAGRSITELAPNQQIHIPDNSKEKIEIREVSTLFYESWINGQIKFDEERLADVAHRLERWYNVEIRFDSEEVANIRFTGTVLKNKPIDQSMKAMSMLLPIQVKHKSNLNSKDVIIISKK